MCMTPTVYTPHCLETSPLMLAPQLSFRCASVCPARILSLCHVPPALPSCCCQLDSKLESAGLSLWADIEVLPGNVPPDCADFIQQALTKNPRARPSAQQLLQHPWLARCQAGEPWRDPVEMEAARRCVSGACLRVCGDAQLAAESSWIAAHMTVTSRGCMCYQLSSFELVLTAVPAVLCLLQGG
jgi:hypothetical protein